MKYFVLLSEGDLVAIDQIKRVKNRPDGFTDIWLVGETESVKAEVSFGEMVQHLEWINEHRETKREKFPSVQDNTKVSEAPF